MSKRRNSGGGSSDLLLFAGLGFTGWYLLSRWQTVSNLNFVPRGLAVVGGAVSILLGVQNPTSNALLLNSLVGTLFINGSNIGNISSFQPVTIAPNAETPIQIYVTANLIGIAGQMLKLVEGNEISPGLSAVLNGTANINGSALPVNITLT